MSSPAGTGGRAPDYGLLFLILVLYAANLYFLVRLDHVPPKWDEAVHLRDSLVYFNVLSDPFQLNPKIVRDIIHLSYDYPLLRPSGYYPPLAAVITALSYFVIGTSRIAGVMSNVLFLSVLAVCVYKVGTAVFNRETGFVAAIVVLLFPIIQNQSVVYMLDLPLTAAVALALYLLIRTEDFGDTKYSVWAGVSFGLGMLAKWTFLFFIIGPLIHAAAKAVLDPERKGFVFRERAALRRAAVNMALFGLASVVVFGPYYLPILPSLLRETLRYSDNVLAHGPKTLVSLSSAVFYPAALWNDMITPYGCFLLIAGAIAIWYSATGDKGRLYAMFFVPYLIFTFVIQNKLPRYMMPWLVPVSLIVSCGFLAIRSAAARMTGSKIRRFAVPVLMVPFAVSFVTDEATLLRAFAKGSREDWNVERMVSLVEADLASRPAPGGAADGPFFMGVIPDHEYINGQTIRYYCALRRLPLNVIKLQNFEGTALREFKDTFDRYRYIVTKDGDNTAVSAFQKSTDEMQLYFHSRIDRFVRMKTFEEPDGTRVSIYKRRAEAVSLESALE